METQSPGAKLHQKAAFVNYVKKWLLLGRKSLIYCLKSTYNNYK